MRKLAIFSESVGDWNVSFLQKHGIASVWKDGDSWGRPREAVAAGLAEQLASTADEAQPGSVSK